MNVFSIVSGAFYVLTYENVRHILQANGIIDSRVRALIGGGCASLVGQTIIVPIDVISQRMMMVGQQVAYLVKFYFKTSLFIFYVSGRRLNCKAAKREWSIFKRQDEVGCGHY